MIGRRGVVGDKHHVWIGVEHAVADDVGTDRLSSTGDVFPDDTVGETTTHQPAILGGRDIMEVEGPEEGGRGQGVVGVAASWSEVVGLRC